MKKLDTKAVVGIGIGAASTAVIYHDIGIEVRDRIMDSIDYIHDSNSIINAKSAMAGIVEALIPLSASGLALGLGCLIANNIKK